MERRLGCSVLGVGCWCRCRCKYKMDRRYRRVSPAKHVLPRSKMDLWEVVDRHGIRRGH